MKVLHFFKTHLPETIGGIEQTIDQIARATANMGVTTKVLTLSPREDDRVVKINGYKVHRCRSNFEIASTPFSASAFLRFRHLVRWADIIHYHYPYPFADVLHFATQVNKPSLVTYHSDVVKQKLLLKIYSPLMRLFLSSVDQIVSTSPNYFATSATLSRYREKTSVIPIGLAMGSYPAAPATRVNYWRKRFGQRFFLFVGVIRYYKGLHILVDAARNSDFPVVVIGAGPVENELKEHANLAGVNNIHFLGFQSEADKLALLELCSGVVFPSHLRSEAFGISLLEGAMYGKPLISSEIGTGTSFINVDKVTGLVIPPSDPVALRRAMDFLWNNPGEASAMGNNAEARYRKLFTAERMARAYVDKYHKLLAQQSVLAASNH